MGSRGPDVEFLQTALRRAGYYGRSPDGIFGENTHRAVTNFQLGHNLTIDGIVGHMTWSALNPYAAGYTSHHIAAGDTLYRLSQQYKTSLEAIMAANPNIDYRNLVPGQYVTIPLPFPVVPTDISFTYRVLLYCIEGLTARYPFINTKVIGSSVNGRLLMALSLGSGTHKVMYNASHHANEWITTPVLLTFLEQYAEACVKKSNIFDRNALAIYEKTRIHIVPMVNPDGVDLVTGALPSWSQEYKEAEAMNYIGTPFPSGWKANLNGVDINLNYPAGWEIAREIKFSQGYTAPGPRDYVGPSALSEKESLAMVRYTNEISPQLTLSYHTQGEVIYWRYLDYLPEKSLEIARLFSSVSGYVYEETPYESGHAGYKDWFIQDYNRPGYTIECGLGINPLPIWQFPKIYHDNLGILTLGAIV